MIQNLSRETFRTCIVVVCDRVLAGDIYVCKSEGRERGRDRLRASMVRWCRYVRPFLASSRQQVLIYMVAMCLRFPLPFPYKVLPRRLNDDL